LKITTIGNRADDSPPTATNTQKRITTRRFAVVLSHIFRLKAVINMADVVNAKMAKFVPELASGYAKYPLNRDRWLNPDEKDPKGEPCFVKGGSREALKIDYVFGRGIYGEGYYSLLTKASYINLHARMSNEAPMGCCACSKAARKEIDECDDVKRIVYNRSVAKVPNDGTAAKDAIELARGTAQAWHNGLQNEQLVIGLTRAF
jgi:hypothetical protein